MSPLARQISEPIVIRRRDGSTAFIDWDFGFRIPRSVSAPHVQGHTTRRAKSLACDPIVKTRG